MKIYSLMSNTQIRKEIATLIYKEGAEVNIRWRLKYLKRINRCLNVLKWRSFCEGIRREVKALMM